MARFPTMQNTGAQGRPEGVRINRHVTRISARLFGAAEPAGAGELGWQAARIGYGYTF